MGAPRQIGRFAMYGEFAAGGMATVHFGRVASGAGKGERVAIKCLHPHLAKLPEFVSRFMVEATLAGRIVHPNVVATKEVVSEGGEVALVMEYVDGESLAELMNECAERGERAPLGVTLRIAVDALRGLHAAHRATGDDGEPLELIHRDVSPSNIMVATDGYARVLDFGIAKAAISLNTTREGQLKGKLRYMGPEQLRDAKVTQRTDVYALSVVLWELVTGEKLFAASSEAATLAKVLESVVIPPSRLVPGLSTSLDAVILRGLERDPTRRFASASEMAEALEMIGPLANRDEVGRWVTTLAGERLAARTAQIDDDAADTGAHAAPRSKRTEPVTETRSVVAVGVPGPARAATTPPRPGGFVIQTPDAIRPLTKDVGADAPVAIGRYVLFRRIAAGGMAAVWLGRLRGQVGFARTVAIKRLHPQFATDPEFAAMFLDEARVAARIRHPNVVPTLDVAAAEGELFLVMEYIEGASLAQLTRGAQIAAAPPPPDLVASILSGVLHGLHAAHEARDDQGAPLNIVHRDVSPQNIMVGTDGVARILDFGIAKAVGRSQNTREGEIKGKLRYMAPEQLARAECDRQADVFSAAVTLWEVLTGRPLFEATNEGGIVRAVLEMPIPPPSRLNPAVSPELDRVVLRGLERDLSRRYPTAAAMAIDLEEAVPLAPPRRVGEWVKQIEGEGVARRAAVLAELERARFDDDDGVAATSVRSGFTAVPVVNDGDASEVRAPRRRFGGWLFAGVLVGALAFVFARGRPLVWLGFASARDLSASPSDAPLPSAAPPPTSTITTAVDANDAGEVAPPAASAAAPPTVSVPEVAATASAPSTIAVTTERAAAPPRRKPAAPTPAKAKPTVPLYSRE